MYKVSLCLHDVRLSDENNSLKMIKDVLNIFEAPLTIHLVIDKDPEEKSNLLIYLIEQIKNNKIEVVFHGLTHKTSGKAWKLFSFYHCYQAEYIVDSDEIRINSEKIYYQIGKLLNVGKIGICPSCWLATKNNYHFFKSLSPLYIESMLSIGYNGKRIFSPVVSLGTRSTIQLFFLKIFAYLMYMISKIIPSAKIRIVIHPCDLSNSRSMYFFSKIFFKLIRRNVKAVLLKELSG